MSVFDDEKALSDGGEHGLGALTSVFRRSEPLQLYRTSFKRALDVLLVLLAAGPVLLLIGVLALVVTLDGGRPFYSQFRLGRNGRPYKLWKLRTMCPDAERALADHLAACDLARAEWDSTQKLKVDPRITPVGCVLRRMSLDELPQLWNVLKGDMSLVGPRPMMPEQRALYPGTTYYDLRPGITGLWQVSERNQSTFADRARYDDAYDECLSLRTDLRILRDTVKVVLRGTGY